MTTTTDAPKTDAPNTDHDAPTMPQTGSPEVWTLDSALGNVGDGSRIAEGFDVIGTRELLAKNVKSIKRTQGSYGNACKALGATRCIARQNVLGPNGRPDWQAESAAYREVIASAEDWSSFTTEDARTAKENVKKYIQRGLLMETIETYVRENVTDKGGESLAEAAPDDIRYITAVREQYTAAGLTPPTKYGGKEKSTNDPTGSRGNNKDDKPQGIVTRLASLDAVATMAHVAAAALALKSMATLVAKLPAGEIADRETVDAMVTETYVLAGLAHKEITGEGGTEATAAAIKTALDNAGKLLAAVKE